MNQHIPNLVLTGAADDTDSACDLVRRWLRDHNLAANPDFMTKREQPEHQARPLVLLAKLNAEIAGGLLAETQFAWLRIAIMSVAPAQRSKGIGAALLAEAERLAISRGCRYAHVDTMSYQAPRFYITQGYKLAGEFPDWDSHGHSKYHFIKTLNSAPPKSRV